MSDTTVSGVTEGVAAYVREVRAELAYLRVDDVDDLTGGMEADLSELAAESGGDLVGRLGSPRQYAAELRSAAGLPEPAARSGRRRRPLGEAATHVRASFSRLTEQHPWLRPVTAFLVTLRPAWWLLRGYLAAWAVGVVLGTNDGIRTRGLTGYALALMAIVVSVQLGRGWLRHLAMTRPLLVLGNSIAVIVALMALGAGAGGGSNYVETYNPPPGVSLNGQTVGNIYVYDSAGERISDVRLFDQDGRPLDGDQRSTDDNGNPLDVNGNPMAVARDSSGLPLMNVYPRALLGSDPWQINDPANPQGNPPPPIWTPPVSIVPLTSTATATPRATVPAPTVPAPTQTALAPTASASGPTATSKPVPSNSASTTSTKAPS